MVDENKNQQKQAEENSGADKPLPKLNELVDRLERANAEAREILKKQEDAFARSLISGQSDAGATPKPKPEETPSEYVDRLLRTGRL